MTRNSICSNSVVCQTCDIQDKDKSRLYFSSEFWPSIVITNCVKFVHRKTFYNIWTSKTPIMQLSIVSPAPYYLGNSGDLAGTYPGIYRILCPRRPGNYLGLTWGDISIKRAGNLLPRDVHICRDSDQRYLGLWGGDLPRDLQEKFPPQSRAVPGAVP